MLCCCLFSRTLLFFVSVTDCISCSLFFFLFKHKTAYELRISDWSSDVCSSDLIAVYVVYIVGSSMNDIAGQMSGPVLTNDPRQRPTVQVWATIDRKSVE